MTATHKRKQGRPIGGKHPEVLRDYWRTTQQMSRAARKFKAGVQIGTAKPKEKNKK